MRDGRMTVYFADDHTMVREGLTEVIARQNDLRIVGQARDGATALQEATKIKPDVVVLDIKMPGLNGLDVCRELVRRDRSVLVLILTMYDNEEFVVRALDSGATGFLLKESAAEDLVQAIRAVGRGDLYLDPGIPRSILGRVGGGRANPYDRLTTRERQVLQLITESKTSREVAEELGLSAKTVETHRMRLMRKLDIHDQTTLVKFAIREGLAEV